MIETSVQQMAGGTSAGSAVFVVVGLILLVGLIGGVAWRFVRWGRSIDRCGVIARLQCERCGHEWGVPGSKLAGPWFTSNRIMVPPFARGTFATEAGSSTIRQRCPSCRRTVRADLLNAVELNETVFSGLTRLVTIIWWGVAGLAFVAGATAIIVLVVLR